MALRLHRDPGRQSANQINPGSQLGRPSAPTFKRPQDRQGICVLKVSARRQTLGQPRQGTSTILQQLGQVIGGSLSLHIRAQGQDDLHL
jgi:hypothetical protein